MTGPLGWLVKLLFVVMLAPFFVCLAAQMVTAMFVAFLPWFIAGAIACGLAIGVSASLILRRKLDQFMRGQLLPPRRNTAVPSGGFPRIKRPRGPKDDR